MPNIDPYKDDKLPDRFIRWIEALRAKFVIIPNFTKGNGSPESVVYGKEGDRYYNLTGSAGTYLYVKTTNGGNTGWIAYG